jgi:gamma-glutamylcyclotransferase (GGCT)/AIG2-like uncharacterized protein YtfP
MTNDSIEAVFVYGTLKTGQCREGCWPRRPREIRKAWTRGELYDTGPYPAMFPGEDMVAGQVWIFDRSDMEAVIRELDLVEEYQPGQESTNLYNRQVIECFDQQGDGWSAFTYIYGRENERGFFKRMRADYSWGERRLAVWPAGADW